MKAITKCAIVLYFLSCPIELGLNVIFTSSTKYIGAVILALWVMGILYNKRGRYLYLSVHLSALIIWIIYDILLTLSFGVESERTTSYLTSYVMMVMLAVIMCQEDWAPNDIKVFLISFFLGTVILSLFVLIMGNYKYIGRLTLAIGGRYSDPNQIACCIVPGVFIALEKIKDKSSSNTIRILCVLIMLLEVYGITMTASRGAMISVIIGVAVQITIYNNNRYINLISYVLMALVFYFVLRRIPENTAQRFLETDSFATGSGRTVIWRTLLCSFDARWLIGHGAGSTVTFFSESIGKATGVHNTFLLVLYESGIIGFSMYIYAYLNLLVYHIRNKNALFVALIIGSMVSSLFLDTLNLRYLWNALIFGVMDYNKSSHEVKTELTNNIEQSR